MSSKWSKFHQNSIVPDEANVSPSLLLLEHLQRSSSFSSLSTPDLLKDWSRLPPEEQEEEEEEEEEEDMLLQHLSKISLTVLK
jgi:hypothetical protein